jgi:hypothetical protein
MFQQPQIFLIDTDEDISKAILKSWSNIGTGTLGTPYETPTDSDWRPVIQNKPLGKFEESDLIIVDLSSKKLAHHAPGEKHTPTGEVDLWAKCDKGWIDARVRTVLSAKADLNRIVRNGGVLIIFAAPDSPMNFQWATVSNYRMSTRSTVDGGVWNLADPLDRLRVDAESGSVINVTDNSPIGSLLKRHLTGAEFTCVFSSVWDHDSTWKSLATNKYGVSVAVSAEHGNGHIFVLPQLIEKARFIEELLGSILPEIVPNLFPDIEKGKWTHRPEYELERVKELESRKALVIAEAEKQLNNIQQEIDENRAANGWLHDLITGTGDDLVNAIKIALSELGFQRVIDVDEIRDAEGKSRREDLRIEDGDPLLIVDIKGVGGRAGDDDIMQANKHALINMRELDRTNIQGLSIINQQRHLPPLERDNNEAFRKEIVDFAGETGLGLLTAFDLYRIVVNKQRHGWLPDWVKPLFFRHQRITAVPTHYKYLGTISKVFTEVFGMHILENEIEVGDYLAVEGDIYFEEVEVLSIQVENVEVTSAAVGDRAGFKWPQSAAKLRENMRVYAIPRSFQDSRLQP